MNARQYSFCKFSSSGNTTVLLPVEEVADKKIAAYAMSRDCICAEQAGMAELSRKHLEMSGGEFCANACRAMGALLDLRSGQSSTTSKIREYEITVSGYFGKVHLEVSGSVPDWQVCANFMLADIKMEEYGGNWLVSLPGISHLLIECDRLPESEAIPELAAKMLNRFNINEFSALGLAWWRKKAEGFELKPYVIVPEAGTAMLEGACGSATMALAFFQVNSGFQSSCVVRQPSGQIMECSIGERGEKVKLSGSVNLCASGLLWLSESLINDSHTND